MALDFQLKDILHRIIAKFVPSYLPTAKKKFHLRAVLQPELDLHGIASKADVYNIATDPKVIEEGKGHARHQQRLFLRPGPGDQGLFGLVLVQGVNFALVGSE